MRENDLLLCIDQGGQSSRALVFEQSGRLLAEGRASIETHRMPPDRVEHDADALVESVRHSIRDALTDLGDRPVIAAAMATQRSSIVCWDRSDGRALSPVISWQDTRAAGLLGPLKPFREDIHERTGLVLSAHYGASKLRWCLDELPEVRSACREGRLVFGPLASFITYRLCAERPLLADPANASRTLLWNIQTGDWDSFLTEQFDIPTDCLPRCVPNTYGFGHIHIGSRAVPLSVVTGDQPAALFAFGAPCGSRAYVNAGTGAFVQRLTTREQAPDKLLRSVVWDDGETRVGVVEGTVNGAAGALELVASQLGVDAKTELNEGVVESIPLFINTVSGLGSPFWLEGIPPRFVGDGTAREKLTAVVESAVFLLKINIDAIDGLLGPATDIVLTGGLASLDLLGSRLADLTGRSVQRAEVREATATGLAWLLAGRPKKWPYQIEGSCFEPREDAELQQRYSEFRKTIASLASM